MYMQNLGHVVLVFYQSSYDDQLGWIIDDKNAINIDLDNGRTGDRVRLRLMMTLKIQFSSRRRRWGKGLPRQQGEGRFDDDGLGRRSKAQSRCFRDTYPEPSSSNVLRLLCADGCCGYRDGSRSKRRFRSVLIPFLWNSQIFRSRLRRQIQGDQRVGFSRRRVGRRRRMRYFGCLSVIRESHSIEQVVLFLLKINLESKVFEND